MRAIMHLKWAVLALLLASGIARAESEKLYFFGNSLIHHLTNTTTTTVPHWMAHFAENNGRSFKLDGQWGFEREFKDKLPPTPEWKFDNVTSAWGDARNFRSVGYDTIVFNPTNFIQYRAPDRPYQWDNPDKETPVSVALNLLKEVADGKKVFVYEGWGDMEPYGYPPSKRKLRQYHKHNIGEYHDWYVEFVDHLREARPDLDIELIPVARVLSRAFLETGLSGIPTLEIYADDMTHGSATLYYLAAAITYAGIFDEMPEFGELPPEVHPLVEPYFAGLKRVISEEMSLEATSSARRVLPLETNVVQVSSGTTAPSLGMGLNAISDWSTQLPFVDLMKTARPWVGHKPGQWGGWEEADLVNAGALDDAGWPKRIPSDITGVETFVLTDMPTDLQILEGTYRLSYKGKGQIDLNGRARPIQYGEGEIWFRYSPGEGGVGIKISSTDPAGTGDYIRDISVVREDQIRLKDIGVTFNPDWIALIKDLRLLRFMDWMQTNETSIASWQDRPLPTDYSYMRRGVPVEVMVDLANYVGADPWFNMPHLAEDGYVSAFADIVAKDLRPGLKAHVEYSNELWNFIFPQTEWAMKAAETRWGRNAADDAWFQHAGLRAAEVMQLWTTAFAGQTDRLVRVAATHTGWPGLEDSFLEAPLERTRPADYFDAYAVTGYFGHELGDEHGPRKVLGWVRDSKASGQGYQAAIERAARELRDNSVAFLIDEAWPHHAKAANRYGLDLIMYEGGTHVVGHGTWVDDEILTEFFTELNYSPEMGAIYSDLMAAWTAEGGKMFNAFVDVATPSKWGSWGALRSLNDSNARFDALMAYNTLGKGQSDGRPNETFANGSILTAAAGGETLTGTPLGDILLGGTGNDTLIASSGHDFLHGGEGVDHAELPGFMEEYKFYRAENHLRAESPYGVFCMAGIETMSFAKMPGVNIAFPEFF